MITIDFEKFLTIDFEKIRQARERERSEGRRSFVVYGLCLNDDVDQIFYVGYTGAKLSDRLRRHKSGHLKSRLQALEKEIFIKPLAEGLTLAEASAMELKLIRCLRRFHPLWNVANTAPDSVYQ